jgi:predicted PurR-regulated permease PerM
MLESATDIVLERSLRRLIVFLGLIVVGLCITFCALASSFCITIVASTFLAILLDPLVTRFEKLHLGRPFSAALVTLGGIVIAASIGVGIYREAADFSNQLPVYSRRIRKAVAPVINKMERARDNASSVIPDGSSKLPEVRVKQSPNWPSVLLRGFGSVSSILVIIGVVPFLTFFMLIKKDQMRARFTDLFESRIDVQRFMNTIEQMIRGFVIGNLIVGSIMAGATSLMFLLLGIRNPVVLGVVTGGLNLIPFVGLLLAEVVASLAAVVQVTSVSAFVIMVLAIVCLHLIAGNMLVPKLIGARVRIGPVAVTVGILFWGWLWGVFGIMLAVPLTAFIKAVADTRPSLIHISNFLAEEPSRTPARSQGMRSYFRLRKV